MTIKKILTKNCHYLKSNKFITNPFHESELLLSSVLNKSCEYLITNPEKKINLLQIIKFEYLIKQRLKNYSIAALIKNKSFYGLDFFVNKNVLIPRPETEIIIDEIISKKPNYPQTIIDVGTGSGCIIITLAKKLQNKKNNFIGIDISKKALKVAKKNAKIHKTNQIQFFQGNLLIPISKNKNLLQKNILITANLPYLTKNQINNSPTIKKEPKKALLANKNGLEYYEKLFIQIKNYQIYQNKNIYLICEIDPSQNQKITKIAKQIFLNKFKIEIKKDLSNQDRFFILTR